MTGQVSDLMGIGLPGPLASAMGVNIKSITGVGTTQGGSSPVVYAGDVAILTASSSNTACTLDSAFPVGQEAQVYVAAGDDGVLFPPTGCVIDGAGTNGSVPMQALQGRRIVRVSATLFRTIAGGSGGGDDFVTNLTVSGVAEIANLAITTAAAFPASDSVTAFAGGGQASATQLTGMMARVAIVASAADSVKLPLAVAGTLYYIRNNGANACQVFGAGTDTINAVATGTGVSQAIGSSVYFCTASAPAGKWFKITSA